MKKQKPTHLRRQQKSSQAIVYWGLAALFVLGGFLLWLGLRPSTGQVRTNNSPQLPAYTNNPAPDFELSSLQQTAVSLEDYAGQVVLVNFWATWCPPCKAEMPGINAFYETHREKGFTVLAINAREGQELVQSFITANPFSFPILLDPQGLVVDQYNVRSFPTTYIIDQDGVIKHVQTGMISEEQLERIVLPLLSS